MPKRCISKDRDIWRLKMSQAIRRTGERTAYIDTPIAIIFVLTMNLV